MNLTIKAIYEEGVLKPLQPIVLAEGTPVSLVITPDREAQTPAQILATIAALPLEAPALSFSNRDHDQVLYGGES